MTVFLDLWHYSFPVCLADPAASPPSSASVRPSAARGLPSLPFPFIRCVMVSRRVSTRRIASAPKKNSLLYLLSSGDCAPTLFIRIGKSLGVDSSLPPIGRVFLFVHAVFAIPRLSPGPPQYGSYLRPPKNAARLGDHELAHRPLPAAAAVALGDAPHAVSHVDVLHLPPHLKKGAKGP